jgi:hypothetical protein
VLGWWSSGVLPREVLIATTTPRIFVLLVGVDVS